MERLLAWVSLVASAVALTVSLWERSPEPAPVPAAGEHARVEALDQALAKERRQVEELAAEVADLQESIRELRTALVNRPAAVAGTVVAEAPPLSHADVVRALLAADGGASALVVDALKQARAQEAQRHLEEADARHARRLASWVESAQTKLGLDGRQVQALQAATDALREQRRGWMESFANPGPDRPRPPSRQEQRTGFDEQLRGVLTGTQWEAWSKLPDGERYPPGLAERRDSNH